VGATLSAKLSAKGGGAHRVLSVGFHNMSKPRFRCAMSYSSLLMFFQRWHVFVDVILCVVGNVWMTGWSTASTLTAIGLLL